MEELLCVDKKGFRSSILAWPFLLVEFEKLQNFKLALIFALHLL